MKKLFILCALLLITASAQAAENSSPLFHPPQTEAEKALENIIVLDKDDPELHRFVLKLPGDEKIKGEYFESLFTADLLRAWHTAQVKAEPNGCENVEGYCGLSDHSVITCGQDVPEAYLYHTLSSTKDVANIRIIWPHQKNDIGPQYRMKRDKKKWKLDSVDCGDEKFNASIP